VFYDGDVVLGGGRIARPDGLDRPERRGEPADAADLVGAAAGSAAPSGPGSPR
jgi:hypothetical protein